MPNIFLAISSLMRLHSPTGYLLSFFPASFGLMLAYKNFTQLKYLLVFFIGSILARSAGCVINDLLDQNLDKKVERTKNRPLAKGAITSSQALVVLAMLLSLCGAILFSLTYTAIMSGVIAVVMMAIYPLMKRITYFPQVFLGLTFNLGCLIGYSAITDHISYNALILYIACGFWTVAYDTVYAFMDLKDDKKIGIKSTAVFFEYKSYKTAVSFCYLMFLMLFLFSFRENFSLVIFISVFTCALILIAGIISLDITDRQNCLTRFKINNYVGFILFCALLLEKL